MNYEAHYTVYINFANGDRPSAVFELLRMPSLSSQPFSFIAATSDIFIMGIGRCPTGDQSSPVTMANFLPATHGKKIPSYNDAKDSRPVLQKCEKNYLFRRNSKKLQLKDQSHNNNPQLFPRAHTAWWSLLSLQYHICTSPSFP